MGVTFDSTETVLDLTDENDQSLREAGIWAMHATGHNLLTESNIKEFYVRVVLWEKVMGAYRFATDDEGNRSDKFFTPDEAVRLIGLRTNSTPKTKAQFTKSVWEAHERWNFAYGFKMPLDTPTPVV